MIMKNSRLTRQAMLSMAQREQAKDGAKPHMSSLLWNMFTGSAPYVEMFRGTLHPGFIYNLMLNVVTAIRPKPKKTHVKRKVA